MEYTSNSTTHIKTCLKSLSNLQIIKNNLEKTIRLGGLKREQVSILQTHITKLDSQINTITLIIQNEHKFNSMFMNKDIHFIQSDNYCNTKLVTNKLPITPIISKKNNVVN